jgi:holo-[acyl-carrier protein] synthase
MKAVGIDIVEIKRIEKDLEKYDERFIDRILGNKERDIYDKRSDKIQFLAGRFAAKEAVIKCLAGILTDRPPYAELQILNNDSGQPIFEYDVNLKTKLENLNFHISISHERKYATAVAVLTEVK